VRMRWFCLVLCFSFLSSMFHAAAMPMPMPMPMPVEATSDTDMVSSHSGHCDEQSDAPALPAIKCSLGGHLCCLGLTATIAGSVDYFGLNIGELINPIVQSLELKHRPNRLFKPPRFSLIS